MGKHRAITKGHMTVGEAAKRWVLLFVLCNTTTKKHCCVCQQKAKADADSIRTRIVPIVFDDTLQKTA